MLEQEKQTEEYQEAKAEKEYPQERRDLVEEMIEVGEAENKKEALSLIAKREQQVTEWQNSDFDPEAIPEFLYRYGLNNEYDTSYFIQSINERAAQEFQEVFESDPEVKRFVELLRENGNPHIDIAETPDGERFLNLSRFKYDDELFQKLYSIFEEIKEDKERLATLVYAMKDNFPEVWFGFEPGDMPFRVKKQQQGWHKRNWLGKDDYAESGKYDYSSRTEAIHNPGGEPRKRFNRMMGREIEYSTAPSKTKSDSDYYFSSRGQDWDTARSKEYQPRVGKHDLPKPPLMNYARRSGITFDQNLIAAVYGEEYLENLVDNLETSAKKIKQESAQFRQNIEMRKLFQGRLDEAKEAMPEAVEMLQEQFGGNQLENVDFDIDNKLLAYVDERSEYGSSGGVGRFSQVVLWADGKEYKKEYQYRDRYSESNDDYKFNFREVKIKSVEKQGDSLHVEIEAIPGKSYGSTNVEFKAVETNTETLPELSDNDFEEFEDSVQSQIDDILEKKAAKHEGMTHFDRDIGHHVEWEKPQVIDKVINKEGFAAFVVNETIDYGSPIDTAMPQVRSELYVMKQGDQKPTEVAQDHKYNIQVHHPKYDQVEDSDAYGDPSFVGLKLNGRTLEYSSADGRRTYTIE